MPKRQIKLAKRVAGNVRLHHREVWPGLNKHDREDMATEVMDSFHELALAAGYNCTWQPRRGVVVFQSNHDFPLPVDNQTLRQAIVGLINQAYTNNGAADLP